MGFFSKLFGSQDLESQKITKFQELERQFAGDSKMINLTKVGWLMSRGNYYGQQNQLDQALTDFKEAIILNSDYTPAYVSLGIAYRAKRMFKEALAILEKAPKELKLYDGQTTDQRFGIYFNLGLIYIDMGDKKKAVEYLEKSLEVNEFLTRDPIIMKQQKILKEVGLVGEREEIDHQELIENIKQLLGKLKK